MELPQDFFPADVAPEVKAAFENPEVVKIVMGYNKGLVEKRDELIGRLSTKEGVLKDLGDVEAAKQKLSQYDSLQAKYDALEKNKVAPNADIEAVRKELQDKIAERDAKLEAINTKRTSLERDRVVKAAMKEAGIQDPDLLFPLVKDRVKPKLTDTDDVAFEFTTANGTPLLNDKGDPGGLGDLINEFKTNARYAPFLAPQNVGGSGARSGGGGNAGVDNPWAKDSPNFGNVAAQTKLYKENKALAVQLAAAAGQKLE